MKKLKCNYFIVVLATVLVSSCAISHHSINPQNLSYRNNDIIDSLSFSYKYDVLAEANNNKAARKERVKNIRVVAVKIENHGDNAIDFNRVKFLSGGREILPMSNQVGFKELRQNSLLYLLYTPFCLYITKMEQSGSFVKPKTTTIPIGLPIGLINILVAASANTNFKLELSKYNLRNSIIQPKETVYGLITVRSLGSEPLSIRID